MADSVNQKLTQDDIVIRKAELKDVPFLLHCSRQLSLSNRSADALASSGFLVSDYTEDQYKHFIGHADHFYIASLPDDTALGFLLAYSDTLIDQAKEWTNTFLCHYLWPPFTLIKQICVLDNYSSKGVASLLYTQLHRLTSGVPSVAAVVADPPNQRSMGFHAKLGFHNILNIMPPEEDGGRELMIWWYANGYTGTCSRVDVKIANPAKG